MAAPSTVYKDYMARRRKAGTPDVDIDLYIAKFLQNTTAQTGDNWGDGYFNAADIPPTAADWSAANAKIKSIFKVDGFLCVPKGTTENGFIGFCYSRTSGNGLYHKTERFSGVRVPTTAHADAELLNDGGLNVMGECSISAVTSDLENNAFLVTGVFRSSFYNSTTAYGIKWSGFARKYTGAGGIEAATTWTRDIDKGTIAPKVKVTDTAVSYVEPIIDPMYNLLAGEEYVITPYITNEEGRKEGAPITHLMSGIAASMGYGISALAAAANGTTETVYKWERGLYIYQEGIEEIPAIDGTHFDLTANGSAGGDPPDEGWWAFPATGSFKRVVKLDIYGTAISLMYVDLDPVSGSGTPPAGFNSYSFEGQGATTAEAETDAIANVFVNQGTITYSATEREWGYLVDETWVTANGYYYHIVKIEEYIPTPNGPYKGVWYNQVCIDEGVLIDVSIISTTYFEL